MAIETEPPVIWIKNGVIVTRNEIVAKTCSGIPYVPATRLNEVWEAAMLLIHETPREVLTGLVSDALKHDRLKLLHAMEKRRAESEKQG